MISRLMLSLKKAGRAKSGWTFMEMMTIRRMDDMQFTQNRNNNPARWWLSSPRTEDFNQATADIFEEIGMADRECMEEPSVPGTV